MYIYHIFARLLSFFVRRCCDLIFVSVSVTYLKLEVTADNCISFVTIKSKYTGVMFMSSTPAYNIEEIELEKK